MNITMIKKSDIYAVILAGGSGTRFWPVSRKSNPKQFLAVTSKLSLLQETVKRIQSKVVSNNIIIVTSARYKTLVSKQLSKYKIPSGNILLEPSRKNTAPAICWAASKIYAKNKNGIMMVLPSDHLISKKKNFLSVINKAIQLSTMEQLVTIAIKPTRPETGYGYLKTSKKKSYVKVDKFTEKPSLRKAERFIKSKNYFWNSGMYVWKVDTLLDVYKQKLPKVYRPFNQGHSQAHIKKIWKTLPNISVDYGILEKASNVAAVEAKDIGWSDLGSWESMFDVIKKDRAGNAIKGNVLNVGTKDSLVWGTKRLTVVVGLKDIIVIETKDALLICHKNQAQHVKEVVSYLQKSNSTHLL